MKPMTPVLGFISLLWILGGSYFIAGLFCPAAAVGPATSNFLIEDTDGNWKKSATGNFSFGISSADFKSTKDIDAVFGQAGNYLRDNPDKMLLLTGIYGSSEVNKSDFANLGVARAESIKNTLVKRGGANPDQISTSGVEKENPGYIEKRLYNSVDFTFSTAEPEETTRAISGVDADGNMMIYFASGETDVDKDSPEMQAIIKYLESYIATNPDYTIRVTGYTDNNGNAKDLMKISKERAYNVRRAIRDYGGKKVFKSKKVLKKAKGPQDPIGSNETEEGRALNNRVTIIVE